jgi:hypothetical protein
MRLALIALAAAFTLSSAYAQDMAFPEAPSPAPAAPANAIQSLQDCVLNGARRLEISREAADVVAAAAVSSCNRELTAAAGPGGVMRSNAETRQQLKDTMRDMALLQTVETRAAANAPPPPKAEPPKPAPRPAPVRRRAAPAPKPPTATIPQ